MHQLTTRLPSKPKDNLINNFTTRDISKYNTYCFYRAAIDIKASKYSITGYRQFQALQYTNNSITLDKTTKGQVKVQFSISFTLSIRFAKVETLISQVEFYIIHAKTLFLLSLADINKARSLL